jgi:SH3 domain-containing YSC84-like protein 1
MRKYMPLLIVLLCCAVEAKEVSKEAERLSNAATVIREIMRTPEKGVPQELLDKAVCVGVIPGEKKLALGVGGDFGRGALVCRRGGNGRWGAPAMFTLGGASFGFQIGGQSSDILFIVMNATGTKKLIQSSVKLGAEASVAAGPVGRKAEGATDLQLHAEILSYSRSKGLFAGVSLEGTVLKQDEDANQHLYGRAIDAKEILFTRKLPVPPAARPLDAALTKYSPSGGKPFPTA